MGSLGKMLSFVRRPEVLEEFECCHVAALDTLGFSQPFCSISSQNTNHIQSHRIIKVAKDLLISWSSTLNQTVPRSSCTQLSSASLLPSPAGADALLGEHLCLRGVIPQSAFGSPNPGCELKFSSSWAPVAVV